MRIAMLVAALTIASSAGAQNAGGTIDRFLKEPGSAFVIDNVRMIDGTGAPARDRVSLL